MKRIVIFLFAFIASLSLLCACEQEDPAAISVNPADIILDSGDSRSQVEVVSTGAWSAEVKYSGSLSSGWLSVSALSGLESRTLRLSAEANCDGAARQALVVFSTTGIGGTVTATLNVIQQSPDNLQL